MSEPVNIIIADDHPVFLAGVRQVLENEPGIRIIAEAANGAEALRCITELRPDVALLDVQMPGMSGIDIARHLDAMNHGTPVVLLTMLDERQIFLEAMDLGVTGYVLKDSAVAEVVRAVFSVYEGRPYISPSLAGMLVRRRGADGVEVPGPLARLSPAERKILKGIAALKTNLEIAGELYISKRTVENHRVNIAQKLNLKGANALLKLALQYRDQL